MKESTSEFLSRDGVELFTRRWDPEKPPRALVALIHGQGEHTGRYSHVAQAMTSAGYALAGFDLRGHGKSDGKRGHSASYTALMDDIEDFLSLLDDSDPGLPRILYGHSLGGGLVLNYCLRRLPTLTGVIATSPWLELAFAPPASKLNLARIMSRLYPALVQSSGLETSALTRDPEALRAYEDDPLVHDRISAGHFWGVYSAGVWAIEHSGEWELPLLLMHGTADRITSHEASRRFAERASGSLEFRTWIGLFHELHNEFEKASVIQTMVEWIDKRLREKGRRSS